MLKNESNSLRVRVENECENVFLSRRFAHIGQYYTFVKYKVSDESVV